jgi:adenylate cyclase
MADRNAGLPPHRRLEFGVGVHLGDVVEEADGDLMGQGVNIAARLEGNAKPGAICLSKDAYRQVKRRLDLAASDLGPIHLKNIAEPVRIYALHIGKDAQAQSVKPAGSPLTKRKLLLAPLVVGVASLCAIAAISVWFFQNFRSPRSPKT